MRVIVTISPSVSAMVFDKAFLFAFFAADDDEPLRVERLE